MSVEDCIPDVGLRDAVLPSAFDSVVAEEDSNRRAHRQPAYALDRRAQRASRGLRLPLGARRIEAAVKARMRLLSDEELPFSKRRGVVERRRHAFAAMEDRQASVGLSPSPPIQAVGSGPPPGARVGAVSDVGAPSVCGEREMATESAVVIAKIVLGLAAGPVRTEAEQAPGSRSRARFGKRLLGDEEPSLQQAASAFAP